MSTMPPVIDRVAWLLANPEEYFLVARHFAEQAAHWQITKTRKPMHRAKTKYWQNTMKGWEKRVGANETGSTSNA